MKKISLLGSGWADLTAFGTPYAVVLAPIFFILNFGNIKDLDQDQLKAQIVSVGETVYGTASFVGAIAGLIGLALMAFAHGRWTAVDGIGKLIALWGACAALTSLILEHLKHTDALTVLTVSNYIVTGAIFYTLALVVTIVIISIVRWVRS